MNITYLFGYIAIMKKFNDLNIFKNKKKVQK